jgi:hypothetical protein
MGRAPSRTGRRQWARRLGGRQASRADIRNFGTDSVAQDGFICLPEPRVVTKSSKRCAQQGAWKDTTPFCPSHTWPIEPGECGQFQQTELCFVHNYLSGRCKLTVAQTSLSMLPAKPHPQRKYNEQQTRRSVRHVDGNKPILHSHTRIPSYL